MHEDTPDDIVHDLFFEAIWGDEPLARRIQGTVSSIELMTRDAIDAYYRRHYRPESLVVAAAGSVDHRLLVTAVEKAFADAGPGDAAAARAGTGAPAVRGALAVHERDIEQCHIVYGTRGISRTDPRRWALGVLNTVLGAGMSSRLFQEVRETRGLAYAVWSSPMPYAETGLFGVYAGTSPENVRDVLTIVRDQLRDVIENGITEQELVRGKGHARGNLALSLEDPGSWMTHLGRSELTHGEILSEDEMMARIEGVTLADVQRVAREVLTGAPWALTILGPSGIGEVEEFAGRLV